MRARESKREKCLEAKKMKENETEIFEVFFFNVRDLIEFEYIVFGLNGAQWVFS